ncbi:PTS sugar transporter subunit IIA [[Mycoplasma] testudinis]|uniref:PTS sugar transporter subunit IIA n=1 Tax=[Mycoplasma] testudinis TaxID=33924 RepID=UPI0004893D9B|nr:PTS sugar transporter subunit IIA [[Mycoplasma] testudinis]
MKKKLIEIVNNTLDWKDAIKKGVNLLVKDEACDETYAEAIFESTKKHGPYYVIAPLLALAHAEAGIGVKQVGLSLVLFKEPIMFSSDEKHKVNLLFTLCTTTPDDHIETLQKFATVFANNPNLTKELIACNSVDDLYEKLKEIE